MDKQTLSLWAEWNRLGLFPGPGEEEEAFHQRVAFCQDLRTHLKEAVDSQLPFEEEESQSAQILEKAFSSTQSLYGIAPGWVPLFFGNYRLAPWHGGCAWIFQLDSEAPTSAFLQLRNKFRESPTLFKIYHRDELVAHELSHVGRMLYQEPQFEEFFAYNSSPSRWRRWLGPIFESSKESFLFMVLLSFVILFDFALLSMDAQMTTWIWGMKLFPAALIGWAMGRLTYRHHTLSQCLDKLKEFIPEGKAEHLLYRLRDSEIKLFSSIPKDKILEWIDQQSTDSFRWRFLKSLYPPISTTACLN